MATTVLRNGIDRFKWQRPFKGNQLRHRWKEKEKCMKPGKRNKIRGLTAWRDIVPVRDYRDLPAKTFRDERVSVTRKELGTKEKSNMAVETRSFERIINLFWCQKYDEDPIYCISCLLKHIIPRLVGFGCKENGCGCCRTLEWRPLTDNTTTRTNFRKTVLLPKVNLSTKAVVYETMFFY